MVDGEAILLDIRRGCCQGWSSCNIHRQLMTQDESSEKLDCRLIWERCLKDLPYPTDSLSIGQLRKTFPNDFTWQFASKPNECVEVLLGAVQSERELAMKAACNYLGIPYLPLSSYEFDRDELLDALAQNYVALGLAPGEHTAQELALETERAAVAAIEARFPGGRRK